MYAKKSLGQHFLRSERALEAIVSSGEISASESVLEIGPGRGALTQKLLAKSGKVTAVEKDNNLFEYLRDKFAKEIASGKLRLIHDDILNIQTSDLQTYKLIANIPYNITGAILEKFLSAERQPSAMVLLVQKEVAQRIVAKKSKPFDSAQGKESILSISVKAYGSPHYIETVKAGSFAPAPKVDSAIIAIRDISKDYFVHFSEKDFFRLLHAGFQSKRKKLSSNLSVIFDKEKVLSAFRSLELDENARAEDIDLKNWKKLAEALLSEAKSG